MLTKSKYQTSARISNHEVKNDLEFCKTTHSWSTLFLPRVFVAESGDRVLDCIKPAKKQDKSFITTLT